MVGAMPVQRKKPSRKKPPPPVVVAVDAKGTITVDGKVVTMPELVPELQRIAKHDAKGT
jgi:biopolymer transport protein ExbD